MTITTKKRLVLGAALAAVAVPVAAITLTAGSSDTVPARSAQRPADRTPARADPAHTAPAAARTVVVRRGAEPAPSEPGGTLNALYLRGALPQRATTATVLSDEDCAPDEDGVSHCTNRLRLANGRTLTVRHPHRMMDVPCLAAGEEVRLTRST